jgi:RNA polymerase sigma-B factor
VLEALASDTAHRPLALDHPRREDAGEPPQDLAVTEEQGFAEVEDAVAVDSLLDRLPARDRLIVELRFRDDMLQREIAGLLGISQMQVSRVLARSIATLRELAAAL